MTLQAKPLSEVTQRAIELLSREIGVVDTIRFLRQFTPGYGDYTAERAELFQDLTLENVLTELKATKQKSA